MKKKYSMVFGFLFLLFFFGCNSPIDISEENQSFGSKDSYQDSINSTLNLDISYGLTGKYDFENSIDDSSGNENVSSMYGPIYWSEGKIGNSSLCFNGTTNYFAIKTGDTATFSLWFKTTNATKSMCLISQRAVYGATNKPFHSRGISLVDGNVVIWTRDQDGKWTEKILGAYNIGSWNFVALVQSTDSLRGYLNDLYQTGIAIQLVNGSLGGDYVSYYTLGKYTDTTYFYDGYMDEVRIYDKALDYTAVNALKNDFQSVNEGMIGYYHMNNDEYDYSGNGNTMSLFNTGYSSDGIEGTSLVFDGVDDYVEIDSGENISFSFWYKTTESNRTRSIVSQRLAYINSNGIMTIHQGRGVCITADNKICAWSRDNNAVWYSAISDNYIIGEWVHVVMTQKQKEIKLYINGQLSASQVMPTSIGYGYKSYFTLGKFTDSTYYFGGQIDQVRIYNRIISYDNINTLFTEN